MIEAKSISYRVRKKYILKNINVVAGLGEVVVITGPNGAGKSTLLKIMAGGLRPTGGQINLNGVPIQELSARELARVRAVMSQHYSIAAEFTADEIAMMGRYAHFNGRPTSKDHMIVDQALTRTGVHHLKGRTLNTLSGGESQRVHLARVLAQVWPSAESTGGLLLLDEPVSSLDIRYQHTILQVARKKAQEGFCVLIVLHDLPMAAKYADRIVLMKNGEVLAEGPPDVALNSSTLSSAYEIPLRYTSFNGEPVVIHDS